MQCFGNACAVGRPSSMRDSYGVFIRSDLFLRPFSAEMRSEITGSRGVEEEKGGKVSVPVSAAQTYRTFACLGLCPGPPSGGGIAVRRRREREASGRSPSSPPREWARPVVEGERERESPQRKREREREKKKEDPFGGGP